MSTTYHFVKIAAGEPFSLPTDNYCYNYTGKLDITIYYDDFINGGHSKHDVYILRPVEPAADGGGEGWETRVRHAAVDCANKMFAEGSDKDLSAPMQAFEKGAQFALQNQPAPVDNVALLEWVGIERWQLLNAVYHATGKAVWHNNKTNRKVTTAALIHEFINQKTKEV